MLDPIVVELILGVVGIALTYFLKQLGDTKRVEKFRENNLALFEFIQDAVLAV